MYIEPLPTEEALSTIYPDTLKNYEEFDARPGLAFRVKAFLDGRSLRAVSRDIPGGGRLLDVGCAAGMLLDVVKRHCPNIQIREGLEISERAAIVAKRKGYKVFVSSIEKAELPSEFYDLIILQQVIEHVHDPRAVLTKLRRALRSGGRLILETPNLHSWDHLLFQSGYWEGYHIPRHFNLWTIDGMRKVISESGFSGMTYRKRIKPVHWTLSLQNWAIATGKPNFIVRFFDLKNPMLLVAFGIVDVIQLALFGKASDIQYVAVK
jgi:SAM-dependent methyltransferase